MGDSAPSIGNIGSVVFDGYNDRAKGVIAQVVQSSDHLRWLLQNLCNMQTHGTRINIRTFIAHNVDPSVQHVSWGGFPLSLEVFIPVRGHPTIAGVAYYGANSPKRFPSDQVRHDEERLYINVMRRPHRPLPNVQVELLNPSRLSNVDVTDLTTIYKASYTGYLTDFTVQSVRAMIENNMVFVVREGREIVSVCVAEMVEIPFEGTLPLRLIEISDAATRRDVRDRGYYSAAKRAAIEQIRTGGDPIPTVITTEARANSGRVLRSNMRLGMVYAGYEPMHCVISSANDEDVTQDNKYGNLVVFYVP